MKLPKSIIAKYGITKKAWQVYRGGLGGKRFSPSSTKKARVKTMARRKSRSRKQKSSSYGQQVASRAMKNVLGSVVAMGYGATRNKIVEKIPKVEAFGKYNNAVLVGGVALITSMLTGNKWVNGVTKPIIDVEMALAGNMIKSDVMTSSPNSNGTGQTQTLY